MATSHEKALDRKSSRGCATGHLMGRVLNAREGIGNAKKSEKEYMSSRIDPKYRKYHARKAKGLKATAPRLSE